jgi:hypothetical protein
VFQAIHGLPVYNLYCRAPEACIPSIAQMCRELNPCSAPSQVDQRSVTQCLSGPWLKEGRVGACAVVMLSCKCAVELHSGSAPVPRVIRLCATQCLGVPWLMVEGGGGCAVMRCTAAFSTLGPSDVTRRHISDGILCACTPTQTTFCLDALL